jgi:uncharacterized protein (DUF1015 family)
MTFVNMHSPGLRILATHRVVNGLSAVDKDAFLAKIADSFRVTKLDSLAALKQIWEQIDLETIRIGVRFANEEEVYLLERARNGALDVAVLHSELLGGGLGITEEAVREEKYLKYVRGADTAADFTGSGKAQVVFLLEPTTIQQVADTSFSGGVMPQKSTDFYPKLLTGLTIYKLEK